MILFMPDISGFTNFVKSVEIEHSKHIISELLETLLAVNPLKMSLAEIEGDALFYYFEDTEVSKSDLIDHVRQIYLAFHHKVKVFESQRICQCGACHSTVNLKLKFVAHYGPSNFIEIQNTKKPYGPDAIAVHRLLKNQIDSDEYILITEKLEESLVSKLSELEWKQASEQYDVENINYSFAEISSWQSQVKETDSLVEEIPNGKLVDLSIDIDQSTNIIYEYLSNFELKKKWIDEVKIQYKKDRVNQAGTKHVCVIDGKNIQFETIKPTNDNKEILTYGEVTNDVPLFKEIKSFYFLEPQNKGTKLKVVFQLEPKYKIIGWMLPLIKNKLKNNFQNSIVKLKNIVEASESLT